MQKWFHRQGIYQLDEKTKKSVARIFGIMKRIHSKTLSSCTPEIGTKEQNTITAR